jgi:DNA-binding transcriptional ArsR family regulator
VPTLARKKPKPPMAEASACRSAPLPPTTGGLDPAIEGRPLLAEGEADRVAQLFGCLAHPTRLRLIHALIRAGELCAGDLADAVGVTPQVASNQLKRLADLKVVARRRDGLSSIYRVIDPCVPLLLERGWCHVRSFDAPEAGS